MRQELQTSPTQKCPAASQRREQWVLVPSPPGHGQTAVLTPSFAHPRRADCILCKLRPHI